MISFFNRKIFFRFSQVPKKSLKTSHPDDYEIMYSLGKGSSARVFLGFNVLTNKKYVVKIFKKSHEQTMRRQIQINKVLMSHYTGQKGVRFIQYQDCVYDRASQAYSVLYNYYHGVPLSEFVGTMTYPQTLKTILLLTHTLNFIHTIGYVHRDIKPGNILMTPDGARLFDFGLAKYIADEDGLKTNHFGTKCYKTPEVVYKMDKYDKSVDIWTLGMVFAELLLNKKSFLKFQSDKATLSQVASFCGMNNDDLSLIKPQLHKQIQVIKAKSWPVIAQSNNINPDAIKLVKSMLQINPKKRATLQQIVDSPIFKDVAL